LKAFTEFDMKLFLRLHFRNPGETMIPYEALTAEGMAEDLSEMIVIGLLIRVKRLNIVEVGLKRWGQHEAKHGRIPLHLQDAVLVLFVLPRENI
jgi:hypothetical protein